jgi:hypothetical protein
VVRVSRVGDRDGERFVSPKEQAERIRSIAERDGLQLVETIEEFDVSGGGRMVVGTANNGNYVLYRCTPCPTARGASPSAPKSPSGSSRMRYANCS